MENELDTWKPIDGTIDYSGIITEFADLIDYLSVNEITPESKFKLKQISEQASKVLWEDNQKAFIDFFEQKYPESFLQPNQVDILRRFSK